VTYIPDLASYDYFGFAEEDRLRSIGWLDSAHPFTTAPIDEDLLFRLFVLAEDAWQPLRFCGYHGCGLCSEPQPFGTQVAFKGRRLTVGTDNLFIPGRSVVYAAPSLILHYILAHQYQPPTEFVDAVRTCPGMFTPEYIDAVKRCGPKSLAARLPSS
jgi:hypothetical protein